MRGLPIGLSFASTARLAVGVYRISAFVNDFAALGSQVAHLDEDVYEATKIATHAKHKGSTLTCPRASCLRTAVTRACQCVCGAFVRAPRQDRRKKEGERNRYPGRLALNTPGSPLPLDVNRKPTLASKMKPSSSTKRQIVNTGIQPRRNWKDNCCGARLDCSTRVGKGAAVDGEGRLPEVTGAGAVFKALLHMMLLRPHRRQRAGRRAAAIG